MIGVKAEPSLLPVALDPAKPQRRYHEGYVPWNRRDLTGSVFGRLTVLGLDAERRGARRQLYWTCRCECGRVKPIVTHNLVAGVSTSCGCSRYRRNRPGAAGMRALMVRYRCEAKRAGRPFLLTEEQFEALIAAPCSYCGAPPSRTTYLPARSSEARDHGARVYNGIDRVDSSRGYETDNVVPCCRTCNVAKLDAGRDEFLAWVERVYRHSCVGRLA